MIGILLNAIRGPLRSGYFLSICRIVPGIFNPKHISPRDGRKPQPIKNATSTHILRLYSVTYLYAPLVPPIPGIMLASLYRDDSADITNTFEHLLGGQS